ncbi:MAG: LCP family protein [Chloroflexi bacterium]|nr:LCP family protein [Chloroflexota bacterium]
MKPPERQGGERQRPAQYGYFPPPAVRRRRGCLPLGCLFLLLAPLVCFGTLLLVYVVVPPEPLDIVILGVDARDGQGWITRTDSVMLMNITPGKIDVSLLSIPRDVFIQVPGYGVQRINTINVLGEQDAPNGGPPLVKASFQESFGVDVDRYVRLDFEAFVELIDAVGGVTIDVPKRIVDYEYPTHDGGIMQIEFEPGRQKMDGERALQYARTRHQDDDYQRAARQQQVIDALVRKLTNPLQIVNWPRVVYVLQTHTDTDLTVWNMLESGPALLLGWSGREARVLNREDLIGMAAGYWVPDYDALQPWIDAHFD